MKRSKATRRQVSKRLAYLLRHAPHEAGLTLERGGWAALKPLLRHLGITRAEIEKLVQTDEKGRYSLSKGGDKIRANQGHSVPVDLGLTPTAPPATLYHGSYKGARVGIARHGLKPMNRHHVHLSAERETALSVGLRRGWPVLYAVNARAMTQAGFVFYRSENGVWLVDAVPPEYLEMLPTPTATPTGVTQK